MNTKYRKFSFRELLKTYRQGENMRQSEMARTLNISKQRLCDIEKGRGNISIKLAKKIAIKLKLSPEWLVKLVIQDIIQKEGLKLKVS